MTREQESIAMIIPQLAQAQYSLTQQLSELRHVAIRLGLYDADDWLARQDIGLNDHDLQKSE